jgi:hypothetical protein
MEKASKDPEISFQLRWVYIYKKNLNEKENYNQGHAH